MSVPHPDPELLVLAALPAEPPNPDVTAHLAGCAACRDEVADLQRTVELARADVGEALPPPPPRVWHAIVAELGLPAAYNGRAAAAAPVAPQPAARKPGAGPAAAGEVDDRQPPTGQPPAGQPAPPPTTARPTPPRRRRVLVPVVAAVLGLLVGLGVGRAFAPEPVTVPVADPVGQLAPVGTLDPGASGTVAMAGDDGAREMVVEVRGVTNLAGGDHLEAWLMDASGKRLVPLGPLDGGGGDFRGTFAVPPGLPLGEFDRVDVSAERWDGNPDHSTLSVVRGEL